MKHDAFCRLILCEYLVLDEPGRYDTALISLELDKFQIFLILGDRGRTMEGFLHIFGDLREIEVVVETTDGRNPLAAHLLSTNMDFVGFRR